MTYRAPATLALTLFACTNATTEDFAKEEQPIAISNHDRLTQEPVASPDGKTLLLETQLSGTRQVQQLDVASGRVSRLGWAVETRTGAGNDRPWYALSGSDGFARSYEVWTAPLAFRVAAPEGTSLEGPAQVVTFTSVTPKMAVLDRAAEGRWLYAGAIGAGTAGFPATRFDLGVSKDVSTKLFAPPNGRNVLVLRSSELGAVHSVRTLASAADGAVTLSDERRIQLPAGQYAGPAVDDSFDGKQFIAYTGEVDSKNLGIVRVDGETGVATTLDAGLELVAARGVREGVLWYEGVRRESGGLRRFLAKVRLGGGPPQVVFSSDETIWSVNLSEDHSTLLYALRSKDGTKAVIQRVDGSPAVQLLDDVVDYIPLGAARGRYLLAITRVTGERSTVLIDDRTGSLLATLPQTGSAILSGDGTAVFTAESCRVGSIEGRRVLRLSGKPAEMIPCQTGPFGRLVPIPESSSVLFDRRLATLGEREIWDATLIAP